MFWAVLIAVALDPILIAAAGITAWFSRTWVWALVGGAASALALHLLLHLIATLHTPFERYLFPRLIAGMAIAAVVHAVARRRKAVRDRPSNASEKPSDPA
jgi:hypothetical protein